MRRTAYSDGKLYFFSERGVIVIRCWPDPRAWWLEKAAEPHWLAHPAPPINLADPDHPGLRAILHGDRPYSEFRSRLSWGRVLAARAANEIPVEVRRLISPLPPGEQWNALNLAARVPYGAELLSSSPALAVALSFHYLLTPGPLRSAWRKRWEVARRWIRLRRRDLAARLGFGFPGAEGVLRKVIGPAARLVSLRSLSRNARDPRAASLLRYLPHLPRLNTGALQLIDPALAELVSFHLLEEVGRRRSEDRQARTSFLLRDTAAMAHLQGQRSFCCDSIASLRKLHDSLIEEARFVVDDGPVFPPPPVPGGQLDTDLGPVAISPIDSPAKLAAEARAMASCCFAYRTRIEGRRSYLYHVRTGAEHATLELVPGPSGWALAQLAGRRNRPAPRAIREAVARWLRGSSRSRDDDEVPF